jgi:hypothetical protein
MEGVWDHSGTAAQWELSTARPHPPGGGLQCPTYVAHPLPQPTAISLVVESFYYHHFITQYIVLRCSSGLTDLLLASCKLQAACCMLHAAHDHCWLQACCRHVAASSSPQATAEHWHQCQPGTARDKLHRTKHRSMNGMSRAMYAFSAPDRADDCPCVHVPGCMCLGAWCQGACAASIQPLPSSWGAMHMCARVTWQWQLCCCLGTVVHASGACGA